MFRLPLFRIRAFTAGNVASLLSALGRGGLQFILIIWLQGIWLPEHGYSFARTPLWAGIYMLPLTAGFLLAAPISGILSDRYGARPFATGGMIVAAAQLRAAELPAGQLLLPLVRPDPADQRPGDGTVRLTEPGRHHEQPAAQPARCRRGNDRDVPELRNRAVDRGLLLPDHPGAVAASAVAALHRADRPGRARGDRAPGLVTAAGERPCSPRYSATTRSAPCSDRMSGQPAAGQGGIPHRARFLPAPDLRAVPGRVCGSRFSSRSSPASSPRSRRTCGAASTTTSRAPSWAGRRPLRPRPRAGTAHRGTPSVSAPDRHPFRARCRARSGSPAAQASCAVGSAQKKVSGS